VDLARQGSAELSPSLAEALVDARLFISAISPWEVATLARKGRLTFPIPVSEWMKLATTQPGLQLLPLTPAISVESAQLDGFHGDPADRILVATARVEGLTLVTRDARILTWASTGNVKALNA
jgi:PIN domain nuclease of toxin-antitoxin system